MTTRTVITRTHRIVEPSSGEFNFVDGDIPGTQTAQFIRDYRLRAWETHKQLALPSITEEAWRRTDLKNLHTAAFRLPSHSPNVQFTKVPRSILKPIADERHAGQIISSPTGIKQELDPNLRKKGVIFTDLMTAEAQHPELLAMILGQIVKPTEGKFAAMAAALSTYGVLLYIPEGVHLEQPLQSILWGPGKNLAYFSHILVWLEDNASVTFVHEAASPNEADGQTLHAGIVEIRVGQGSHLRFVELQSWGNHVWNFSHERIRVNRDGILDWIFGAIGSHLTKNFSELDLIGEGATGKMSGFYFTDGDQHLDHDTQQNHLAPHTTSDLLFKGALQGQSRSVWQGMIYVAPGAQKTDGYQANRNLILSPKARADSIPGLEILADDVRCTHGATVGKIDPEEIFYLRSRGIIIPEAERLIVEGFFDPIMQRIPFEGVRKRFQNSIEEKMHHT